jgi:hypothetical protein
MLSRHLNAQVSRLLTRAFSTCAELVAVDPEKTASQLGLPPALVVAAQDIARRAVADIAP